MRNLTYLHRNKRSGVYYFRMRVPEILRAEYGQEIKLSLHTRELMDAKDKVLQEAIEWGEKFSKAKPREVNPKTQKQRYIRDVIYTLFKMCLTKLDMVNVESLKTYKKRYI